MNIDLKSFNDDGALIVDKVYDLIKKYNREEITVFIYFFFYKFLTNIFDI